MTKPRLSVKLIHWGINKFRTQGFINHLFEATFTNHVSKLPKETEGTKFKYFIDAVRKLKSTAITQQYFKLLHHETLRNLFILLTRKTMN